MRDVHEWLAEGVAARFCSPPACATHEGIIYTDDELADDNMAEGYPDVCVYGVRLFG